MGDSVFSTQFRAELRTATIQSRSEIGNQFSFTANRAKSYYNIATVLRNEAERVRLGYVALVNSGQINNPYAYQNSSHRVAIENLLGAARLLETQAEITTYSGEAGAAAKIGNYNALINNRGIYNTPLDVFSWEIDSRVVNFFEIISATNDSNVFSQINSNSILAVDGIVWNSKGLINHFPGTGLGIDYRSLGVTVTVH